MGEVLPNGEIQGYSGYCQKCNKAIRTNIQGNEIGVHYCEPKDEKEWILERASSINGICTFHLNDDFSRYCDLFIDGGYNNFRKGQVRLRSICNKLEKQGFLYSEWGGTGAGGGMDFGTKRYKSWYTVDNKWRKL